MNEQVKKYDRGAYIRLIAVILITIIMLFPIYWMVMTAFKPMDEWLQSPPVYFSLRPTLDNFKSLMGFADAARSVMKEGTTNASGAFFKGFFICSIATILSVGSGTLAAYSISRYRIGGNFLPLFILSARMFPPIAVALPLIVMYSSINAVDTYWGLVVAYTGFTLPFSVWMMKSFIDEVPRELEETGIMEGMSNFQAFYKVTVPLVKTGIMVTTLFIFILNWSEFIFALTLSYQKLETVPVFLATLFSATAGWLYGPQAALGVLAVIPVMIFGYMIQEHLARGFTFGALKR